MSTIVIHAKTFYDETTDEPDVNPIKQEFLTPSYLETVLGIESMYKQKDHSAQQSVPLGPVFLPSTDISPLVPLEDLASNYEISLVSYQK